MDALENILTRRSIRQYKPDPVDEATLEKVLEAARWAPSWANTQCARFIVVRDAAKRAELSGIFGKNPATGAIAGAPVVIVACAEMGKSGFYKGEQSTDKGDWFMYDVALAMQNLSLAARNLGLGTVHIGLFDAKKAAEILNVPEGYCVVSMTPLGYPDQEAKAPPRKDLAEIVSYDTFGNS